MYSNVIFSRYAGRQYCISGKNFSTFSVIPVKIYANADTQKLQIIKENTNKSGVYLWKNLVNQKQYIGSSIDLRRRFNTYFNSNHLLKYDYMYINRVLLKYGYSNFSLTILEYCEPEQCLERENFYLSCLSHEYNILATAGSSLGNKHSKKSKQKISDAMIGNINSKNHPNAQQIEVTDIQNDTTTCYASMGEAAKSLNLPNFSVIRNYILRNQQKPYKGRYHFKYK